MKSRAREYIGTCMPGQPSVVMRAATPRDLLTVVPGGYILHGELGYKVIMEGKNRKSLTKIRKSLITSFFS